MELKTYENPDLEKAVHEAVEDIAKKIEEEVVKLFKTFKEVRKQEKISGLIIIKTNEKADTKYCYATEMIYEEFPTLKTGIRVVCEMDFMVYDDEVTDTSDIRGAKIKLREELMRVLWKILKTQ